MKRASVFTYSTASCAVMKIAFNVHLWRRGHACRAQYLICSCFRRRPLGSRNRTRPGAHGSRGMSLLLISENRERQKHEVIDSSLHVPYGRLEAELDSSGLLTDWRKTRENCWCSTAPSGSAQQWRSRQLRRLGSRRRATFKADSTPGSQRRRSGAGSRDCASNQCKATASPPSRSRKPKSNRPNLTTLE